MTTAFFEQTGATRCTPSLRQIHRWRYAIAERPLACGAWVDRQTGIALAGDWLAGVVMGTHGVRRYRLFRPAGLLPSAVRKRELTTGRDDDDA